MASGGSGQAAASEVRSRSACAGGTVPPCCRVIEIDDLRRGQTLLLGGHAPPPPALLHHIAPSVLRGPASNPSTPVRLGKWGVTSRSCSACGRSLSAFRGFAGSAPSQKRYIEFSSGRILLPAEFPSRDYLKGETHAVEVALVVGDATDEKSGVVAHLHVEPVPRGPATYREPRPWPAAICTPTAARRPPRDHGISRRQQRPWGGSSVSTPAPSDRSGQSPRASRLPG